MRERPARDRSGIRRSRRSALPALRHLERPGSAVLDPRPRGNLSDGPTSLQGRVRRERAAPQGSRHGSGRQGGRRLDLRKRRGRVFLREVGPQLADGAQYQRRGALAATRQTGWGRPVDRTRLAIPSTFAKPQGPTVGARAFVARRSSHRGWSCASRGDEGERSSEHSAAQRRRSGRRSGPRWTPVTSWRLWRLFGGIAGAFMPLNRGDRFRFASDDVSCSGSSTCIRRRRSARLSADTLPRARFRPDRGRGRRRGRRERARPDR